MITLKLNLTALKHALMKSAKDEKETLLCIPIKANELYKSEKGNVYLDIVGFEFDDKSDKKYKDTHLLKQSFSKERLSEMTEEEKKAHPILGNARVSGAGAYSEPEPNAQSQDVADGVNDLPF